MSAKEQIDQLPLHPGARRIKRLGGLSMLFFWLYGVPGILFGILCLAGSRKALRQLGQEPDAWNPLSYREIALGKMAAVLGLVLSGFILFYYSAMFFFK